MTALIEGILEKPGAREVLRSHGLLDEEGQWPDTPLLDLAVIQKFSELDRSNTCEVLDWMLLQAGGGQKAKAASARAVEEAKAFIIEMRMQGVGEPDPKTGERQSIKPMSLEEAHAEWAKMETDFRNAVFPAGEDVLDWNGDVFGYAQLWPGRNGIYERVYAAVKEFQGRLTEAQPDSLQRYGTLTELEDSNRKLKRAEGQVEGLATVLVSALLED